MQKAISAHTTYTKEVNCLLWKKMAANLNSTTITKNNHFIFPDFEDKEKQQHKNDQLNQKKIHSKIVIKLKQVELKEKKKNMLYLGCKMKFR